MRRILPLLIAVAALAGCGSYKDDMQMMCDAPKAVDPVGLSPEERAEKISLHIAKNTRSAQARQMFQALAQSDPEGRARIFESAVKEAGLDPAQCEMLKSFE